MELAVNMFTGGMVLDSHPLVQSSDTLSDALNATYITMNGNEVVLLNDMGNRRVDNAFLPAGYEPVGIKEHGGIIYIAAYNPITHRSQIGSFPSPERNMGTEYKDNGTEFNLTDFISENNVITTNEGVKFLKSDTLLYPLTKDTSLHAGDKFTVYSGDIWSWGNNGLLTNFGTEDGNGVHKYDKTPFNSYFTLSLGVINSLNEFSDITASLERFDSFGNIIKGLDSDEDKFNTGYFIAPDTWKNLNGLTSNDATLINEREKIGANTYAYKLTGPLYLKAEVNHILTFSYSINMSKVMTSQDTFNLNLYITGTATYNCPDSENVDNNLLPYFDSFKLLRKDFNNPNGPYLITIPGSILSKDPRTYDLTTGLYTSTITKHFVISGLNVSDFASNNPNRFLKYLIAVPLFHPTGNYILSQNLDENVYLSNLSETGSLDVSKIGTNECELNMWKYKNTIEDGKVTSTILDYRFDCYKDLVTAFNNLKIELFNLTTIGLTPNENSGISLNDIVSIPDEITSGRQEFLIDWANVEEEKRINFLDLYLVKITYNQVSESEQNPRNITTYRFILGTKLFNPCYNESSEDYISDFGIFMGKMYDDSGWYKYHHNPDGYNADDYTKITTVDDDRNKLRKKYLNLWNKITIAEDPILYSTFNSKEITGSKPISKSLPISTYSQQVNTYEIKIKYDTRLKFEDEDLLIKDIGLKNSISTAVTIPAGGLTSDKEANIIKTLNLLENELTYLDSIVTMPQLGLINNDDTNCVISFPLLLNDRIYIGHSQDTKIIGKAYVDLDDLDFSEEFIKLMSPNLKYFCICTQVNESDDAGYCGYIDSDNIYGNNSLTSGSHDIWGVLAYIATIWMNFFLGFPYFDNGNYDPKDAYDGPIKSFFKNMKCPFTFGFCCSPDITSDAFRIHNNYYILSDEPNFRKIEVQPPMNPKRTFWVTQGISDMVSAQMYTRVWWTDEEGNPCLLNNNNNSKGVFYGGYYDNEDNEILIRNTVYLGILNFLGTVKVGNSSKKLVVPLENFPYKAYYVNSNSYLYSDNTKVSFNVNLNYRLQKTTDNNDEGVTYNNNNLSKCCLQFYINPTEITENLDYKDIKKDVNKNYYLGKYALKVFDFSQILDLSSYSIDLKYSEIISDKDPIKHLYVRGENMLKEVPKSYPLQINEGTKNSFPIVCKKLYNSYQNLISRPYLINPLLWTGDGPLSTYLFYINQATGEANTTWTMPLVNLDPSTKNIPVLYEEDLAINNPNFFNT